MAIPPYPRTKTFSSPNLNPKIHFSSSKRKNERLTMAIDIDQLNKFLFEANEHGYGGESKEVPAQRPGFTELEYTSGDWKMHDSYAGHYFAPGQEVVYYKDEPVWAMAYAGGMEFKFHGNSDLDKETYPFLKKALLAMDPAKPFRGPEKFEEGEFKYVSTVTGNTKDFTGNEKIYKNGTLVFEQNFIGGIIVGR